MHDASEAPHKFRPTIMSDRRDKNADSRHSAEPLSELLDLDKLLVLLRKGRVYAVSRLGHSGTSPQRPDVIAIQVLVWLEALSRSSRLL